MSNKNMSKKKRLRLKPKKISLSVGIPILEKTISSLYERALYFVDNEVIRFMFFHNSIIFKATHPLNRPIIENRIKQLEKDLLSIPESYQPLLNEQIDLFKNSLLNGKPIVLPIQIFDSHFPKLKEYQEPEPDYTKKNANTKIKETWVFKLFQKLKSNKEKNNGNTQSKKL